MQARGNGADADADAEWDAPLVSFHIIRAPVVALLRVFVRACVAVGGIARNRKREPRNEKRLDGTTRVGVVWYAWYVRYGTVRQMM